MLKDNQMEKEFVHCPQCGSKEIEQTGYEDE